MAAKDTSKGDKRRQVRAIPGKQDRVQARTHKQYHVNIQESEIFSRPELVHFTKKHRAQRTISTSRTMPRPRSLVQHYKSRPNSLVWFVPLAKHYY